MMRPTEPDADALEQTLDRLQVDEAWLIGTFVALRSGPELVPPSVWLPVLMEGAPAVSAQKAQKEAQLLLGFYNVVGDVVEHSLEELLPDATDTEDIEAFCAGYFDAAMQQKRWVEDGLASAELFGIGVLAGAIGDENMVDDDGKPIEDVEGWKADERKGLANTFAWHYEHWRATRRELTSPVRKGPKVGVNDPCPCGSGKKFKKCCALV
jgi:uncharacterized protein